MVPLVRNATEHFVLIGKEITLACAQNLNLARLCELEWSSSKTLIGAPCEDSFRISAGNLVIKGDYS